MKRLTTAVMLLLAVLALCVGTQYRLGRLADEMAAEIDHFSLCARENDIQSAERAIAGAKSDWESSRALLGSILPHNELDEIDRLFAVALQAAEDEDVSECRLRAAELSNRVQHLPKRDIPKIENIL